MCFIIKYAVALLQRGRARRRCFNTRTARRVFLGLNKKGGSVTNERNIIRNSGVEKKGKRKQSSDLCGEEREVPGGVVERQCTHTHTYTRGRARTHASVHIHSHTDTHKHIHPRRLIICPTALHSHSPLSHHNTSPPLVLVLVFFFFLM